MFNQKGKINYIELYNAMLLVFTIIFILTTLIMGYIYNSLEINIDNTIMILKTFYMTIIESVTSNNYDTSFIYMTILISVFSSFFSITLYYLVKKFSRIQSNLSSLRLPQYSLFYKWNNLYVFRLRSGAKMDFNRFVDNFSNSLQLFKKGSLKISRYKSNMIKVQFKENTPSITDLKDIQVEKYLKKNKLFLGFYGGLKEKIEPKYIDFKKILHMSNTGTSGGGKSNTLNMFILSLIYNFDSISNLVFLDMKGGIEAAPYVEFEKQVQTKKIDIVDNRKDFLLLLKEVEKENKRRIQVLIDTKQKQYKTDFIFIVLDEVAELLQFTTTTKQEKEDHLLTISLLESLFRTGRSQGIKIIVSTQSYVQNASGLSGQMKNNIKTKCLHLTETPEAIASVFPESEVLKKEGIEPTEFTTGEYVISSEDFEITKIRSIYINEKAEEYTKQLIEIYEKGKK